MVEAVKVESRRKEYRDPMDILKESLEDMLMAVMGILRYPPSIEMKRSRQS